MRGSVRASVTTQAPRCGAAETDSPGRQPAVSLPSGRPWDATIRISPTSTIPTIAMGASRIRAASDAILVRPAPDETSVTGYVRGAAVGLFSSEGGARTRAGVLLVIAPRLLA